MPILDSRDRYVEREIARRNVKAFRFYESGLSEDEKNSVPWEQIALGTQWNEIKIQIVKRIIESVGIARVLSTRWYTRGRAYPQLITTDQYNNMPGGIAHAGQNRYASIGKYGDEEYYLAVFAGAVELMLKTIRLSTDLGLVIEFKCE